MTKLEVATATRNTILNKLKRIENYAQGFNKETGSINQLKARLTILEDACREFEETQSEIEQVDKNTLVADHIKSREEFETRYCDLVANINDIIDGINAKKQISSIPAAKPSTSTSNEGDSIQPNLPVLNLKAFSGSYKDWTSFENTFKSVIEDNKRLNKRQCFQYLKSCLHDEALRAIESLSITDENYAEAWKILEKRFKNTRLIVQDHVFSILNAPDIGKTSPTALRQLLDTLTNSIASLNALKLPTDSWDALLVPIIAEKLDYSTKREWEMTLSSSVPSYAQLIAFLEKRCSVLESLNAVSSRTNNNNHGANANNTEQLQSFVKNRTLVHTTSQKNQLTCYFCKRSKHNVYQCVEFLKLGIPERLLFVQNQKLCTNCLRDNHDTKNCKSNANCRTCGKKHNTLLHSFETTPEASDANLSLAHHGFAKRTKSLNDITLLSTAIILVKDKHNKYQECRAFLDMGSMSNFISNSMCQKLGLQTRNAGTEIRCLNNSKSFTTKAVDINIKSRLNNFSTDIRCLIVDKVTENLPIVSFDPSSIKIPANIRLADPKFSESRPVDLLLGAGIFWNLLCVGQIVPTGKIVLQKTHLGFIVGGSLTEPATTIKSTFCNTCLTAPELVLETQVAKLWELESEVIKNKILTNEEQQAEKYYQDTTKRAPDGRFIVRLPAKNHKINVGLSRNIALKRFTNLERNLDKNPELKEQYVNFINEYKNMNHMEQLEIAPDNNESVYLPHHAVLKESSATTKLRVVFDASAKTTNGLSLNDNLMLGPVIQQDLFSILIRFRTHKYVLNGDIAKMYRQITMHPEDANFQLILWRDNKTEPVKTFRLTTLTYGTKPASFIATRCLQELAENNENRYPVASEIIKRDFYMDDLLTGAESIQELKQIREDVCTILNQGQFQLRKFQSSDSRVIDNDELDAGNQNVGFDKNHFTKTLGLYWNAVDDRLKFEIKSDKIPSKITKRTILSVTAQIFDPLGLVGPIVMRAKLIIQKLWSLKLSWDESVPYEVQTSWISFLTELAHLREIKIPRNVISMYPYQSLETHGFCDASKLGYGAVIYVRAADNQGNYETKLMCSKSRVAPLKPITLPRLELCGALLLARLCHSVQRVITIPISRRYLWTDSSIVLAWINSSANSLKTFVAHRIAEIQSLTHLNEWRHVRTENNAADILSRGSSAVQLLNSNTWFKGPTFLNDNEAQWPLSPIEHQNIEVPDKQISLTHLCTKTAKIDILAAMTRCSFLKVQRICAWVLRFIHNCKNKNNKYKHNLSTYELQNSLTTIVRLVQEEEFKQDLHMLRKNTLSNNSKLMTLDPFIDNRGVIRVGGRLKHANLQIDVKHPMLLPKNHIITKLIIQHEHEQQLHAGAQATLAALRQRFWIISARNSIRQVLHFCQRCFRVKPIIATPKMGDLPSKRVHPGRPFLTSGVDYAGPVLIRESRGRGKRLTKAYIAIFICFATKAVHIELVSDLSAETFLNALRRFVARRGLPRDIYSDNGTNFVGANNELKELIMFFENKEFKGTIEPKIASMGINWHFMPPKSPHMGGLWEINVKCVKQHLKKVVGCSNLTYEEMNTLLVRIEACLNSRPLTPLTSDPNDLDVLTPGHFLIGEPLTAFPEYDVSNVALNRLSRWQLVERIRTHFWKRWSREYITQLQGRPKWRTNTPTVSKLKVGTMVLLVDDNMPPLQWKIGRIVEIHPGDDDVVRVVTVRTAEGTYKRSSHKVCVLPMDQNSSDSASAY